MSRQSKRDGTNVSNDVGGYGLRFINTVVSASKEIAEIIVDRTKDLAQNGDDETCDTKKTDLAN